MDLVATLTAQLGLDQGKAEGLAGTVLGMVKSQIAGKVGAKEADQFSAQIPELERWAAKAESPAATGGAGGGLLGTASSLLGARDGGGLDLGGLTQLAGKFGLNLGSAQTLVPIVVDFLKSKLDSELLGKVLGAVPLLSGKAGAEPGLSLGGLFR